MATESKIARDYIQPKCEQQMEEAFSQLHSELEKGYADMQAGRTVSADQAFADIYAEFGI